METWQLAASLVLALGVVVIAYGFITDRMANRALSRALHAPPRAVPGQRRDAPSPQYLTGSAVRANAPTRTTLSAELTARLRTAMDDPQASVHIDAGYASADFVNDTETGWAVAVRPQVLVCDYPLEQVGELIGILQGASAVARALVLVAPGYATDILRTLEVNVISRTIGLVAIIADDQVRDAICRETGADQVAQSILRGDALRPEQLGEARAWVSDQQMSWLIRAAE